MKGAAFPSGTIVSDQREDLAIPEPAPAVEERELDDEAAADHAATAAPHQLDRGGGRAAGGEQVVDDEHAMVATDRVVVDLERVAAVLELVARGIGLERELAGLPHQHDAGAEAVRDRGADDEAARLDAEHQVGAPTVALHEPVHGRPKGRTI